MEKIFELRTEYVRDMKDEEKELTEEQYLNSVKEGQNIVEIIDKLLLLFIYCKSLRKRFVALMSLYNVDIESIQATIHQQYQFMADGA